MEAKFFELDNRMEALRAKIASFPAEDPEGLPGALDVSWIFHDHALEGVVLSYSELKAADRSADHQRRHADPDVRGGQQPQAGGRLHPRGQRRPRSAGGRPRAGAASSTGCSRPKRWPRAARTGRKTRCTGSTITRSRRPRRSPTRCASCEEWLESPSSRTCTRSLAATRLQFRLLAAYPWTKNSGKVARLLTNYILHLERLPARHHPLDRAPALLRGPAPRERRPART